MICSHEVHVLTRLECIIELHLTLPLEIINVRRENEQLQTVIDSFKNEQFALQTQVEKLKLKHKEQHAHFRSEV